MVNIPYIKIPQIHIRGISSARNIYPAQESECRVSPAPPPTPITYLTQWKMLGNSEVHNLPYPDGVVLPTGYKRCEYLTFDGSSYINTGVKTANDIGYDLRFKSVPTRLLIGGRYSAQSDGFVTGYIQINKVSAAYGVKSSTDIVTTNNFADAKVHHIILDSVKFQIDDEVIDISSLRGTAENFYDIYLGTWNNNGTPDNRMWISNIYDTIIYNTQGELWHGIPCLDANDVPCFYDIVSQTAFYNQGSGSFTYKLYPQPTEIWSCGEYNPIDGKWHILVQPQGGSIADIALTEPLRKVNDVADTIEFPSDTEGKALVTRNVGNENREKFVTNNMSSQSTMALVSLPTGIKVNNTASLLPNILIDKIPNIVRYSAILNESLAVSQFGSSIEIRNTSIEQTKAAYDIYFTELGAVNIIYELATPTTELVDAPQIAEADSYSCVISQGAKAVSWSSFETE